jgi:hypothetical protein
MKLILFFSLALFLMACSTSQVIRDSEYKYSEAAFRFSDPEKALKEFPKKERHGFITSVEKSWLGLWNNETDQRDLLVQSKSLDERKYTSIQREAEYFFFNESEEGYIPAEHEVVIMHMISAMYFMKSQQWSEARVETKKAAYFLQSFFSPGQKHFDDPALRLWLAGLWIALGEWDEAQVDLRRAYELNHDKDLLPWLNGTKPPSEFSIVFDGAGPAVTWTFGNPYPAFAQRDEKPTYKVSVPTLAWFQRHQQRNSAIRDQVLQSNYMSQYYGVMVSKGSEKTMGVLSTTFLRAAGVVVGCAIVGAGFYVLGATSASGATGDAIAGIAGVGLLAGSYMWQQAEEVSIAYDRSTKKIEEEGIENLKTYRFVRFLPSWISATDTIVLNQTGRELQFQAPNSRTKVHFVQKF